MFKINLNILEAKVRPLNNIVYDIYELEYYCSFNKINFNKNYTDDELRQTDFYKTWIKNKNDYNNTILNDRLKTLQLPHIK